MREKLEDAYRNLEESRNSLDKLKRDSQARSEKDRLQIGEFQLEISRLKGQLEEMATKFEGSKAHLTETISREKEAKLDMVCCLPCSVGLTANFEPWRRICLVNSPF